MSLTHTNNRHLYRSRNGWILGVCRGLADYAGVSAVWVRLAVLVAFVLSSFWPVFTLYVIAAILMKPQPLLAPRDMEEWEAFRSYTDNRTASLERMRKKLDQLDRRTRNLESVATQKEYDWERRLYQG